MDTDTKDMLINELELIRSLARELNERDTSELDSGEALDLIADSIDFIKEELSKA